MPEASSLPSILRHKPMITHAGEFGHDWTLTLPQHGIDTNGMQPRMAKQHMFVCIQKQTSHFVVIASRRLQATGSSVLPSSYSAVKEGSVMSVGGPCRAEQDASHRMKLRSILYMARRGRFISSTIVPSTMISSDMTHSFRCDVVHLRSSPNLPLRGRSYAVGGWRRAAPPARQALH